MKEHRKSLHIPRKNVPRFIHEVCFVSKVGGSKDKLLRLGIQSEESSIQTHSHSPLQGPQAVDIHQGVSVDQCMDVVPL